MPKKQTKRIHIRDDATMRTDFYGWLEDMLQLFAGGPAVVSFEKPKRSLDQNSRYWAMLTEIAEAFRDSGQYQWHIMGPGGEMVKLPVNKDTLHGWFKRKYITPEDPTETPSTTRLDKTAFSDYMEQIKHDEDVRQLDITFRDEDKLANA